MACLDYKINFNISREQYEERQKYFPKRTYCKLVRRMNTKIMVPEKTRIKRRSVSLKDTKLYSAIMNESIDSIKEHMKDIKEENWRDLVDESKNTILHFIILSLSRIMKNTSGAIHERIFAIVINFIYRITVLGNCPINAQNKSGNTALHIATFRPMGDKLVKHLMRLGSDPSITNDKGMRVIYDWSKQKAWLSKGQYRAKGSIWDALKDERIADVTKYLGYWTRVQETYSHRFQNIFDVAEESGNFRLLKELQKFALTNEFFHISMTLDLDSLKFFKDNLKYGDKINFLPHDKSQLIPTPLVSEILMTYGEELAGPMIDFIEKNFAKENIEISNNYFNIINNKMEEERFYSTKIFHFFQLIVKIAFYCNQNDFKNLPKSISSSYQEAYDQCLKQIEENNIEINASSILNISWPDNRFSFLHLAVFCYRVFEPVSNRKALEEIPTYRKVLLRIMYKLAINGINIQSCDNKGQTALVLAAVPYQELYKTLGIEKLITFIDIYSDEQKQEIGDTFLFLKEEEKWETNDDQESQNENEEQVEIRYRCKSAESERNINDLRPILRPETAFHSQRGMRSSYIPDQILINHLLRIGIDSTIGTRDGYYVAVEKYVPRGIYRLMHFKKSISNHHQTQKMAGLWPLIDLTMKQALKNSDSKNSIEKFKEEILTHYYRLKAPNRGHTSAFEYIKSHDDERLCTTNQIKNNVKFFLKVILDLLNDCEFVTATLANDPERMINLLATGNGIRKCCTQLGRRYIGLTNNGLNSLHINRPILIEAMELCDFRVVKILLDYGADLKEHFREHQFCGPLMHWIRYPQVPIKTIYTIVAHENFNVNLRDAKGRNLLIALSEKHRCLLAKNRLTPQVLQWLVRAVACVLHKGINISARRSDIGYDARDIAKATEFDPNLLRIFNEYETAINLYGSCNEENLEYPEDYDFSLDSMEFPLLNNFEFKNVTIIQDLIDRHVANLCQDNNYSQIEELILNNYTALELANTGPPRYLSGLKVAELAGHEEIVDLIRSREEIDLLHRYVRKGDEGGFTRLLGEQKSIYGCDSHGRSILHVAVICGHLRLALKIAESVPILVNVLDCHDRTPLHMLQWLPTSFQPGVHTNILNQIAVENVNLKISIDAMGKSIFDYQNIKKSGPNEINALLLLAQERYSLPRDDEVLSFEENPTLNEAPKSFAIENNVAPSSSGKATKKAIDSAIEFEAPSLAYPIPGAFYRMQRIIK